MPTKVHELITRLEGEGWFLVRQKGKPPPVSSSEPAWNRRGGGQAKRRDSARHVEHHTEASRLEEVRPCVQYLVVIEQGPASFGAYAADLPGCVAVGDSRAEVTALIHEAIEFHIEGLRADGATVPRPSSTSELVEIDA